MTFRLPVHAILPICSLFTYEIQTTEIKLIEYAERHSFLWLRVFTEQRVFKMTTHWRNLDKHLQKSREKKNENVFEKLYTHLIDYVYHGPARIQFFKNIFRSSFLLFCWCSPRLRQLWAILNGDHFEWAHFEHLLWRLIRTYNINEIFILMKNLY